MYVFPALFTVYMFGAALNSKNLGISICACVGTSVFYPIVEPALFIMLFYVGALFLAAFRE